MSQPKLLLTRPWPEGAQSWLQARFDVTVHQGAGLDAAGLIQAMRDYDALGAAVNDKLTAEVFAAPELRARLVANFGVGYEHIDTEAATRAGIIVTNTPDVLTEATADIALMLMLMASRRAGEAERQLRAGQWKGWGAKALLGQSLQGKTLGLVGFGRIAQATARKARDALGMEIIYYGRHRAAPETEAALGARFVADLDALLAEADVVSLHVPGGADTHHMIDAARLVHMRASAILINTARGPVVDEAALARALTEGRIRAAGLDVYEHEPDVHPALLKLENAVLLPHLGSATVETREAMGMRAAENIALYFAGKPVRDRSA
ncbi:D-glycerate dehydrogenase [Asticcacaulis sp. EMRT-3]|uniref:2-hydroxyacid dehydrogenase n=1 Tax=Asticcacaulis sp. EMRT-3 TaxID=3040349 RepID=UPI0024AEF077|nr:D-glycerate dehydrogenase [Asticcacaulis sp. EMRT-3]MDI7774223.1 D-glycerate dehydrogenase [Asticcacaulis sp. EMRT-3]